MSSTFSPDNATNRDAVMRPESAEHFETVTVPETPIEAAAAVAGVVLRQGGMVALPTETVYGLAASAQDPKAVGRVYAAKGRPSRNPLIVHVEGRAQAETCATLTPRDQALMDAFWPGPLTLVLPRKGERIAPAASAGGDTVAVRCPATELMRRLCLDAGPLVAPSANRSGRISATSAEAVAAELSGRIGVIVDGGPSPVGIESTVIDCTGEHVRLLRPGAVASNAISAVLGARIEPAGPGDTGGPLTSPGLLSSHYAPAALVRLNVLASDAPTTTGYLGFGPEHRGGERGCNLSESGDLTEAAQNLYWALRTLDAEGVSEIAVAPIPNQGLGAAINDRLRRAAAPRPGTNPNEAA